VTKYKRDRDTRILKFLKKSIRNQTKNPRMQKIKETSLLAPKIKLRAIKYIRH